MTSASVVDDGGGKAFALQIAEQIYDCQASFDWDFCDPRFNLGENWLQRILMTRGPAEAIRLSEIESLWRQIAWSYRALGVNASTAMGFCQLMADCQEEPAKHYGMKMRFQSEFESFLFRLFSLRERIFHMSNFYHRKEFNRRDLRGGYWKALKDGGTQDEFTKAVDEFLEVPGVDHFLRLRRDMTHNFELSLVGIGWAPLVPKRDEQGKVVGILLGASYQGSVDFDMVVVELRHVYEAITRMLRQLDVVLGAEFAA